MKPRLDRDNMELERILEQLFMEGTAISARTVAKRHSQLHHASDFTRVEERRLAVEKWRKRVLEQKKQTESVPAAPNLKEKLRITEAAKQSEQRRADALAAALVLCIRAVGASGGNAALDRFFGKYEKIAVAARRAVTNATKLP